MQKDYVRSLFDGIAHRYDLLNHLLSGGVDIYWRRKAIEHLVDLAPQRILDVATGTADFAIASLRLNPDQVVGVDISEKMLEIGRKKLRSKGLADRITLRTGDAEHLSSGSGEFDAAIVAFGVRNFENLEAGLRGMHSVLRSGGMILVLEFSRPKVFPLRQLYLTYFRRILPWLGQAVSRHPHAYRYLPETVMQFPEGEDFLAALRAVGFCGVEEERLTGGIASVYSGRR